MTSTPPALLSQSMLAQNLQYIDCDIAENDENNVENGNDNSSNAFQRHVNTQQQLDWGAEDDEDDNEESSFVDTPFIAGTTEDGDFPKARSVFGFMGFLGFAVVYAMRVNLSVAIVAMVNQTAIPQQTDNDTQDGTCPREPASNSSTVLPGGDFVWDEATQGLVLGSFFYGYVLTQVPGGRMAEILGGKFIYGYGVLITAIFTILTPIAAYWDMTFLIIVRVLEGMGEGVTYPAMHAMLAHWIPPMERNKFAAVVYAGSNIGTVISLPLAGWLCSLEFMGGWPLCFHVFGIAGIVWFIFWMYLVYDKPSVHPRISRKERDYIERSIRMAENIQREKSIVRQQVCGENSDNDDDDDDSSGSGGAGYIESGDNNNAEDDAIPWGSILTSVPLWAILITQCGQSWAFYTQLTELPTYMSNILHFDIQSNALLNAVPYMTSWLMGIGCSALADWMLQRGYISTINSYKLWNSISSIIPSLGIIGVGYVGCSWQWVTFMLAGVCSFAGAMYAGNQMNHISLSPKYAGTMYGITNSVANICGFMAPYVIGSIINHNETFGQWKKVFLIAAAFNIGGNFIYLIFGSADEQPWSNGAASTAANRRKAKRRQHRARRRRRHHNEIEA